MNAAEVLLNGLSELEYRGYDSAGIACFVDETVQVIKSVGKVSALKDKVKSDFISTCGIGHTRWATHGGVTEANAHSHRCGNVTLIHNGIIENYHELDQKLAKTNRYPVSQTETEIAAMLIDSLYDGDAYASFKKAVDKIEGAYGFGHIFDDRP